MKKQPWLEWAQRKPKQEALGTISQSERQIVNALLQSAGFDGNGQFQSIGQALNKLSQILSQRRIVSTDIFAADIFSFTSPPHNFYIGFLNPDDVFDPIPITNSMLSVSWYERESGTWEILARLT